jgi:hypothetical protein
MAKGKFRNRVQKNTSVLNSIRKALPENTRDLVVGMATGVEEYYRDHAPRDTSSMAESAYVQLKDGAYQQGKATSASAVAAGARALNPDAEIVELPKPTNDTTAYVAPIVGHWLFVEHGTTKMAARPILLQARKHVQSRLKSEYAHLFVKVATNGHK